MNPDLSSGFFLFIFGGKLKLIENMRKIVFISLLQVTHCICLSQDTIFSDAYPKGIIVDTAIISVKPNKNIKIDKGEFTIDIDKDEVIKVTNSSGIVFQNAAYLSSLNITVPIDPTSGKIFYTEVVEVKGVKKKDLYEALKALPNTAVTYNLVSKDETEFSSIFYRGSFFMKYAGDLNVVFFEITIKIKDEKIKYELSNFRLYFTESKQTNMLGNTNYSTLPTNVKNIPLEKLYTRGHRTRWTEMWGKLAGNFDATISNIKTTAKKSQAEW